MRNTKIRIAVITSSYTRYPGDGIAPFVKSISESLFLLGNNVEVVAPYDPDVHYEQYKPIPVHRFRYIWPKSLHIMGHSRALKNDVNLHPLALFLIPLFLVFGFLTLLRVTGKQKTDVIHAHWVLPNGLIAAWVSGIRKIPFIISLHGSDIYISKNNPIFTNIARWIFQRSSGVTSCSPELLQSALEMGAPRNSQLIAWGADPELFNPLHRKNELRSAYLGDQKEVLIVSLGRLVLKKGFDTLLESMVKVINENPKVHLILGGDGPQKDRLNEIAKRKGIAENVTFLGAVPWNKVPDLLASADIFVLPSKYDQSGNVDGLPTVLLEAMSSGLAVVASDIGGVSLVIENGTNGILVSPNNPTLLADTIVEISVSGNLRQSLAVNARQSIVNSFSWEKITSRILRLFETVYWQNSKIFRLGSIYRLEMTKCLNIDTVDCKILDVGCYDGLLLNSLDANLRVGVDLEPIKGAPGVEFVKADGRYLPFKYNCFERVFSFEVIEHVVDPELFADSIQRVIAPEGILYLSTPSSKFRIFPPFLTNWTHHKWGHIHQKGFDPNKLTDFFMDLSEIKIFTWNAPFLRLLYIFIRFVHSFLPSLSKKLVIKIARLDNLYRIGDEGYYLLEARKDSLT